ncbi:hypothetical protein [uncultured Variovorax sp.]|jgi:hypothetical protein|uniref:hypothetical protein n=1 Tax=uncultured Variovorax sp. TaxID=114708 RepID=UPI00263A3AA0|nr:hypothetical protein [uncultured Variovorax sp.]
MYQLKTPFKARRDGADIEFTELPFPEVITVKMMRKVPMAQTLLAAHVLAEQCAGLNQIEASKLTTPDALDYANELQALGLLTPSEEPGFKVPEIKPVKSLIARISADPHAQRVDFAAQVLQLSGMSREEIDEMDYRAFEPAIAAITAIFIGPNK